LTRPEEEFGKGEEKQWKVTGKCMYQFDIEDTIFTLCNKIGNEL
jgi:hypothetical protein